MDGNLAGWVAGDAAAHGRNSSNLRRPGAARLSAPAASWIGVAAGDHRTAVGGRDTRRSWPPYPALACAGAWPQPHPAGLVDGFLSRGGDYTGDAGAYRDLSSGAAGGEKPAQRLAGRGSGYVAL